MCGSKPAGTDTEAENIGRSFSPMMPEGMALMQLGAMLGDPQLTNLQVDKPFAALVTAGQAPLGEPGIDHLHACR